MSELVKPPKGATVTLRFLEPDGKPMNGFGSSFVVDPWKKRMEEIAREKRRKRLYKAFLVVAVIIRYCAKKVFLNTD